MPRRGPTPACTSTVRLRRRGGAGGCPCPCTQPDLGRWTVRRRAVPSGRGVPCRPPAVLAVQRGERRCSPLSWPRERRRREPLPVDGLHVPASGKLGHGRLAEPRGGRILAPHSRPSDPGACPCFPRPQTVDPNSPYNGMDACTFGTAGWYNEVGESEGQGAGVRARTPRPAHPRASPTRLAPRPPVPASPLNSQSRAPPCMLLPLPGYYNFSKPTNQGIGGVTIGHFTQVRPQARPTVRRQWRRGSPHWRASPPRQRGCAPPALASCRSALRSRLL